jgi:hypothetical protein
MEEGEDMHVAFPLRAFVQVFDGKPSPESKLVMEELESRDIPVVPLTTEVFNDIVLKPTDLVVGDFDWTRTALKKLGVPMPEAEDYPACLSHLLHRRIWTSTLGEVQASLDSSKVFIKPLADTKAFAGLLTSSEDCWVSYLLEQFPPSFPIFCSEVIEMVSEYRVYCVNGEVKGICHYKGPKDVELDVSIVEEAAHTLFATDIGRELTGCSLDFAVMRKGEELVTGLIEVNDGFSLGYYEGVSRKDYTDMCIVRWERLMSKV